VILIEYFQVTKSKYLPNALKHCKNKSIDWSQAIPISNSITKNINFGHAAIFHAKTG
jgi:hypothetical protein